ncbi:S8 family peptidase [Niveibacterium terrae]|uniref:S8 family peptidase n=1 Tax=Niveibacterium terrae TaxID=3373598 RepID=UPI003A914A2C
MKLPIRSSLALVCALLAGTAFADENARVIVKYRNSSTVALQTASSRATILSSRTGESVSTARTIAPRMDVVQASNISSAKLAARLAAQADVEYAVPDRIKKIKSTPNDPLYSTQWNLLSAQPAAINAQGAWGLTTGSSSIVVAVVDTGIRPEHPDLKNKLFYTSGGTVYGYDFVSGTTFSNDGDGRDSDPTDPGDYVTSAEAATQTFKDASCTATNSSWHGTQVASIVAAETNNSTGMAGVAQGSMILPVRVLGKCGGYDSDIIAGMRWAAGLAVSGVPTNQHPAKIINMSLGGVATCSAAYQEAISEITNAGVLVVAAAGNESGAVDEPANCSGVLAVAGVRHNGSKVGYSSYGAEVGISAPAGNCVNTTGSCVYPIITAKNSGTTSAVSSTYSDSSDYSVGTSFASPQAAGVAALMLAGNSALTPTKLISLIKTSATAFTTDSTLKSCNIATDSNGQCNCTTTTCGAGMLNALAAVTLALKPSASITTVSSATAGTALTLDGSGSSASGSRTIASYAWSVTSGSGIVSSFTSTDQAKAVLLPSAAGTITVSLTVTDSEGLTDTTSTTFTVAAASTTTGGTTGGTTTTTTTTTSSGGGGGALDPLALIALLGLAGLGWTAKRR